VQSAIGNHVDAIVLTLPTVVSPITQGLVRAIGLAGIPALVASAVA